MIGRPNHRHIIGKKGRGQSNNRDPVNQGKNRQHRSFGTNCAPLQAIAKDQPQLQHDRNRDEIMLQRKAVGGGRAYEQRQCW